jgi:hypothetical protein
MESNQILNFKILIDFLKIKMIKYFINIFTLLYKHFKID